MSDVSAYFLEHCTATSRKDQWVKWKIVVSPLLTHWIYCSLALDSCIMYRADSRLVPSQWETSLQSNTVSLAGHKPRISLDVTSPLQPSDSVELCSFEFTDQAKWKAMSGDALRSVCTPGLMPAWPTLPPLCGNPLDSGLVSNDLEREIRALVLEYRRVGKGNNFQQLPRIML